MISPLNTIYYLEAMFEESKIVSRSKYEELISNIESFVEINYMAGIRDLIIKFKEDQKKEENEIIEFAKSVCEAAEVDFSKLSSKNKRIEMVQARQIIMSYLRIIKGKTEAVAGAFVGRDHATVRHAIDVIKTDFMTDRAYRIKYNKFFDMYPELLTYELGRRTI